MSGGYKAICTLASPQSGTFANGNEMQVGNRIAPAPVKTLACRGWESPALT